MQTEKTSFFKDDSTCGGDLGSIFSSGFNLKYDKAAKSILSNKTIVANLLHEVVPEFKDYTIADIKSFLPTGITSAKIQCNPEDDTHSGMALVSFDVNAHLKSSKLNIDVEIDIEPQNKSRPGYSIYKRGVYYCCRMIDRQLSPEDKNNYDILHKCYSIWICFQPKRDASVISYKLARGANEHPQVSTSKEVMKADKDTDLIELIYIYMPESLESAETYIQKFLYAVFNKDLQGMKLCQGFSNAEYEAILKEVTDMRGLGDELRAEGMARGRLTEALALVEGMLSKGKIPLDEALEYAKLDAETWNKYLELGSVDALLESMNSD